MAALVSTRIGILKTSLENAFNLSVAEQTLEVLNIKLESVKEQLSIAETLLVETRRILDQQHVLLSNTTRSLQAAQYDVITEKYGYNAEQVRLNEARRQR